MPATAACAPPAGSARAAWSWTSPASFSERWSLIGSYAWLAAEVTEDPTLEGKRLQNVARNTASLSAVYELGQLFGGDRLRLGGGARYVGKRPGDPANSFDLPSYTVADAFASYDTRFGGHGVKFRAQREEPVRPHLLPVQCQSTVRGDGRAPAVPAVDDGGVLSRRSLLAGFLASSWTMGGLSRPLARQGEGPPRCCPAQDR